MNITCIVVDDEPLAIDKMTEYIQRIPYLKLEKSFDNAIDALDSGLPLRPFVALLRSSQAGQ